MQIYTPYIHIKNTYTIINNQIYISQQQWSASSTPNPSFPPTNSSNPKKNKPITGITKGTRDLFLKHQAGTISLTCRESRLPKTLQVRKYMGVSKNRGTPKSSILIGIFHYKPSILGYHYFWKHPYIHIPLLKYMSYLYIYTIYTNEYTFTVGINTHKKQGFPEFRCQILMFQSFNLLRVFSLASNHTSDPLFCQSNPSGGRPSMFNPRIPFNRNSKEKYPSHRIFTLISHR